MYLLPFIHIIVDLIKNSKDTLNPSGGDTVYPTMLTGQKICQLLIKYSSFSTYLKYCKLDRKTDASMKLAMIL